MSNLNLMVGDWVQSDGKLILVFHLDSEMGEINRVNYGSVDSIEPIPLSPEVMEKIGGCKYDENEGTCIVYDINIDVGLSGEYYFVTYDVVLTIQHLHQLQQLIRLFTEKEIEVKWEK